MVYLIKAGRYVKIGWSEEPQKRLSQIQTGSAEKCKIIATIRVSKNHEKKIHKQFEKFRTNGGSEWFDLSRLEIIELQHTYGSKFRVHGKYLDFYHQKNKITRLTREMEGKLIIPFGKYKGMTFSETLLDPDAKKYWGWFLSRDDFDKTKSDFNKSLKFIIENDSRHRNIMFYAQRNKQGNE